MQALCSTSSALFHALPRTSRTSASALQPSQRAGAVVLAARKRPRHLRVPRATDAAGAGGSGADEPATPSTSGLTTSEAYQLLGLEEGSSYDDVLLAKNRLLARSVGDQAKCDAVEAAYDRILMAQMQARLSGNLPVSANVRFADVAAPKPRRKAASTAAPSVGGLSLPSPGGLGVTVRAPPAGPLTTTSALVFGALAAWTLAQGLLEPSPAAAAADVPGLQLALGCAASVYLLRQAKRSSLPKALGITVAGLVAGTLLGSGVESWLRVDLSPLGGLSSPGIVVGEFGLAGIAAAALFLS